MEKQSNHEGICVAIRMRPLNEKEIASGQEKIYACHPQSNSISQSKYEYTDGQTYYYDKVFDGNATTAEVYSHIAKDIVKGVVRGINGTIFACKFIKIRILI
jgi:centromeric protein E